MQASSSYWHGLEHEQLIESAWILASQIDDEEVAGCLKELLFRLRHLQTARPAQGKPKPVQ